MRASQDQILNAQRTAPIQATEWGANMLGNLGKMGGTEDTNQTKQQQITQPTNWLTTELGLRATLETAR
jgi:hypothetical protein